MLPLASRGLRCTCGAVVATRQEIDAVLVPEVVDGLERAEASTEAEAAVLARWEREAAAMPPDGIMQLTPRQFAAAFYGPCVRCPLHKCDVLTRARCESGGGYPL